MSKSPQAAYTAAFLCVQAQWRGHPCPSLGQLTLLHLIFQGTLQMSKGLKPSSRDLELMGDNTGCLSSVSGATITSDPSLS